MRRKRIAVKILLSLTLVLWAGGVLFCVGYSLRYSVNRYPNPQSQQQERERVSITQQDNASPHREQTDNQENYAAKWFEPITLLTVFLVIGVTITAYIYWRQLKEMQKTVLVVERQGTTMQGQLEVMRDTLAETQRIVTQNERAVKASETQAKAAQESLASTQLAMKEQAALMQKSIETAEKSSIYANRAYITASIKEIEERFCFHLTIENTGNTPANDVHVNYAFGLRERPPIEETEAGQFVWDMGYTVGKRLGVISPKNSLPVITPKSAQLNSEQSQRWRLSQIKFYCWGRIDYQNIFNENRVTWFCFYQSQGHPKGYPYKHGNEAI
jgi:hypothetical protein